MRTNETYRDEPQPSRQNTLSNITGYDAVLNVPGMLTIPPAASYSPDYKSQSSEPMVGQFSNTGELPFKSTLKEADPFGKAQNEPGAKVDAGKVRMGLIIGGMARALREVARVGTFGAAKYSDGGWVHVPNGFSRYEDAQQRHVNARHRGETFDQDSQLLHLSHEAWNALAKLDLYLRAEEAGQDKPT